MDATDFELLTEFTQGQSQDAFAELVRRHVDLVHSAALRQAGSHALAQDVSQVVFSQLACHAPKLRPDTILSAWLYRVTRHAAIDALRSENRRRAREQVAFEMSAADTPSPDWARIEPRLDEAMEQLTETDRAALVLRYFENKSLRQVGEELGLSDDAAQKRVARALDRLRSVFVKQRIPITAAGLAGVISAHAVQAAPAALAGSIAAATAAGAASALPLLSIAATASNIAMTTAQKFIVAGALVGALAVGIHQARRTNALEAEVLALQRQQEQARDLAGRLERTEHERDLARQQLAALQTVAKPPSKGSNEVLKLRGEVGRLRRENAEMGASSSLSKVTANPEARKMLREQQKMGMSAIYGDFVSKAKLKPELTEKLFDLQADLIMANVGHVTEMLKTKPGVDQIDKIFRAEEQVFAEQLETLLGPEAKAQYDQYSRSLLGTLTSLQFAGQLEGSAEEKKAKTKQIAQWMEEETQALRARSGLAEDFQFVPMLNFRNIASEQEADKSLQYLTDIYTAVAARGKGVLSASELEKLAAFQAQAIKNNRGALSLNRSMMEPLAQP